MVHFEIWVAGHTSILNRLNPLKIRNVKAYFSSFSFFTGDSVPAILVLSDSDIELLDLEVDEVCIHSKLEKFRKQH